MQEQNFSNHRRFIKGYHYFTSGGLVILFIGSIVNIILSSEANIYSASLICFAALLTNFVAFYCRIFALKAQDRGIRAEENFRHYLLTNKPLSNGLKMRQIIGLRFAPDAEFPDLAIRAEKESLSENDIKKAIKNWKADTYRV